MSQETQSIFGPGGLLAKLEVEEKDKSSDVSVSDLAATQGEVTTETGEIASASLCFTSKTGVEVVEQQQQKRCHSDMKQATKASSVPLNNLPAIEAAFSIKKIRDKILSYASPKDLINCRLVSREWRHAATNQRFLGWIYHRIRIEPQSGRSYGPSLFTAYSDTGMQANLEKLTQLMDSTGPNPFICSSFVIQAPSLKDHDSQLQMFLNNHGFRIKKLRIEVTYYNSCNMPQAGWNDSSICECGKNWLRKYLTRLLVEQLPNLEHLTITFGRQSEPSPEDICSKFGKKVTATMDTVPSSLNLNLRFLSFRLKYPLFLLDFISGLAPRLDEVYVQDLSLYLKPKNRLHLLKQLEYAFPAFPHFPLSAFASPSEANENLEFIPIFANIEGQMPQLRMFTFDCEGFINNPKSWPLVATACNKLLEKSCISLKELWLNRMGFLPGLKMPKMENIGIIYFKKCRTTRSQKTTVFPRGSRMSEMFPRLRSIRLFEDFITQLPLKEDDFFGCIDEVITSVRVVYRNGNRINVKQFQKWFPNANIYNKESLVIDVP